jgi:hypothetical protein
MPKSTRQLVKDLAAAAGISAEGMTLDQLDAVAIRITVELGPNPTPNELAEIYDAVRFGKRAEGAEASTDGMVGTGARAVTASSPAPSALQCCTPIKTPMPSGWWVVHSKFCPETPSKKIRHLTHPAGTRTTERLRMIHDAEDGRAAITRSRPRQMGSCAKCDEPTLDAPYCSECRSLLTLVKEARR